MRAINYYLVVSDIKEEQKKIAGMIFTEKTDVDNRYTKAKIISCGDKVDGVVEGDIVYYDKHAGHSITHKDDFYKVIKIVDIVLVE
jgi:co-chaperonin GroES (HSP10)|tara:strand:+ start:602 stop:859 length:258 start_codon:yes stop_codon:yes gene_type:complete